MNNIHEIHRYQNDTFQYIVATTNKYTEEQVRQDVERFNAILSNEMKSQGIRYIFVSAQKRINDTNMKDQEKGKKSQYPIFQPF